MTLNIRTDCTSIHDADDIALDDATLIADYAREFADDMTSCTNDACCSFDALIAAMHRAYDICEQSFILDNIDAIRTAAHNL